MNTLKVTVYEPNGQRYAPRIREDEWELFRPIITQLHSQRVPRKVMLKQLREEFSFEPTIGQLQAKMKEWKLTVYLKDTQASSQAPQKLADPQPQLLQKPTPSKPTKNSSEWLNNAFDLVFSSGYIEEWSDDYRIHPASPPTPPNQVSNDSNPIQPSLYLYDRALPPEYLAGGLLANSANPHWPMPTDLPKAEAMIKAADYYYALQAYTHAFSLYRTVYLYKRKHSSLEDLSVIFIALRCACSAVTEHQRNIAHSVLTEIGRLPTIDNLDPLLLQCLQSASLSMLSGEDSNGGDEDQNWAWAAAHLKLSNVSKGQTAQRTDSDDPKVVLYAFEHNLLLHEHNTNNLVNLFKWCDTAVDKLHYDLDDIFVGYASCDEEYQRRVAQMLGGHLIKEWAKSPDPDLKLSQSTDILPASSFSLGYSELETIITLAFMIVDAARFCSQDKQNNQTSYSGPSLWYLDAAKNFKRALRFLARLDTRGRCEGFSRAYLERFYATMTLRHKMHRWNGQVPAVVDSVGIAIARSHVFNVQTSIPVPLPEVSLTGPEALATSEPLAFLKSIEEHEQQLPVLHGTTSGSAQFRNRCTSPVSDEGSITSFLNTHIRSARKKLIPSIKSRGNSSFDAMSAGSMMDWKFSAVTGLRSPGSAGSFTGQLSRAAQSTHSISSWAPQDSPASPIHYVQDGLFGISNPDQAEASQSVNQPLKPASTLAFSIDNSLDFSSHDNELTYTVLDIR